MRSGLEIEVCIASIEELEAIEETSIDRIELCSALEIGGITPSLALIEEAVNSGLETHVLIRPRGGDFYHSKREINLMKSEIQLAAESGIKGVVFGILTNDLKVTRPNEELALLAKSYDLNCTFHRAFEFVKDQERALQQIIHMGFDRLLTSGGPESQRIDHLLGLMHHAKGQIEIMVGGGVNSSNVVSLAKTGVNAVHFSVRKWLAESNKGMGRNSCFDPNKLNSILDALKRQ